MFLLDLFGVEKTAVHIDFSVKFGIVELQEWLFDYLAIFRDKILYTSSLETSQQKKLVTGNSAAIRYFSACHIRA